MTLKKHQITNRDYWQTRADWYVKPGEKGWRDPNPKWGIWGISDDELTVLPADLNGKNCLEIGCGAGYVSAWMARRGAFVVGVDPTPNQLSTAVRLNKEQDLNVHFVEGFGETLPFADETFDFAISEYGAALWAAPYEWIPEASRVLKPGASLHFMTNHSLSITCMADDETEGLTKSLQRPYLSLYKTQWPDEESVEFHLPHGKWIELLVSNGFEIKRLIELGAPSGSVSRYQWANSEWGQSWPTEEIWCVTKTVNSL